MLFFTPRVTPSLCWLHLALHQVLFFVCQKTHKPLFFNSFSTISL